MRATTELGDFVAALNGGRLDEAQRIADALPKGSDSKTIAHNILAGRDPNRSGTAVADIPAATKEFPLSKITPAEAAVGWQKPAYDHLPRDGAPLLVSGAELFATGIYAHAPARHAYDFPDGSNWKKLTGKCGLPIQNGGSVVFIIKADGKDVFRSPTTEHGTTHAYDIDLRGVNQLELITQDAGDGKAADWALWLAPMLGRCGLTESPSSPPKRHCKVHGGSEHENPSRSRSTPALGHSLFY